MLIDNGIPQHPVNGLVIIDNDWLDLIAEAPIYDEVKQCIDEHFYSINNVVGMLGSSWKELYRIVVEEGFDSVEGEDVKEVRDIKRFMKLINETLNAKG